MHDDNGYSRGFGFVCHTLREEAARAINEHNGSILSEKTNPRIFRSVQKCASLAFTVEARKRGPAQEMKSTKHLTAIIRPPILVSTGTPTVPKWDKLVDPVETLPTEKCHVSIVVRYFDTRISTKNIEAL